MLFNKNKLFWIKIGLFSGFTAAFIFLLGTTIAILLYPDYSFFTQFISELGVRKDIFIQGTWLYRAPHPEALNITLILTGIFFLPLFPSLYFFFNPKENWRKILFILISLGGIVAGIFLSLVGVFDAGLFLDQHVIVALGSYFSSTAILFLWGLVIITLEKHSPYKSSFLWIIDPIICLLGVFVGIVNTGLFDLIQYVGGIDSLAFYQKSLAYLFVILFSYVGIRMIIILKKHPDKFL